PWAVSANPAAPTATVARLGTCSRNNMYGPGLVNTDFGLARVFPLFHEGRNLEFRWEAFNLLNTPYFGLPNASCAVNRPPSTTAPVPSCKNGTFGRITQLQGDPRTMQFALKFTF